MNLEVRAARVAVALEALRPVVIVMEMELQRLVALNLELRRLVALNLELRRPDGAHPGAIAAGGIRSGAIAAGDGHLDGVAAAGEDPAGVDHEMMAADELPGHDDDADVRRSPLGGATASMPNSPETDWARDHEVWREVFTWICTAQVFTGLRSFRRTVLSGMRPQEIHSSCLDGVLGSGRESPHGPELCSDRSLR